MVHCRYSDTTWKGNHSATLIPRVVGGRRSLRSEICAQSDPPHFEKRRLRQISAYNVSTVRDSERSSLTTNRKLTRAFQRAINGVRTLPLSPVRRVAQKAILGFWVKFNFNRIKSATKFLCVKTFSGKNRFPFRGRLKTREWKMRYGQNCKGGKCRSGKCRSRH